MQAHDANREAQYANAMPEFRTDTPTGQAGIILCISTDWRAVMVPDPDFKIALDVPGISPWKHTSSSTTFAAERSMILAYGVPWSGGYSSR